MKNYIIIILMLLAFTANAQEPVKAIKVGDKVPESFWQQEHTIYQNGKTTKQNLSAYKGKLLLLDFWATWCSPCIAMIPKMDSLQKAFGDKIQFLSVTYQMEKEVLPFLEKFEKQQSRKFNLPVVTAEQQLHQLFPHVSLPHYVWIDAQGMVKAITGYQEVNEPTLRKVLTDGQINVEVKNDVFREFNPQQSLSSFLAGDNSTKKVYQTTLSGHILGVASQTYSRAIGESYTITAANLSLRFLYKIAYSGKNMLKDKMVELAVADSSRLTYNLKGNAHKEWIKANTYCYQIKVPNAFKDKVLEIMRNDLALFFTQYDATVQRKQKKCWVLKVVGDTTKLRKSDAKPYIAITPFKIEMRKANLAVLVNRLDQYDLQSEWPLFLNDGLNVEVNLLTEGDTRSITGLNKMLLPYGLAFVAEFREQDVLVIKDRLEKGLGDED